MSGKTVATKLTEITSRIFGHYIGDGFPSGRKLLRRGLIGDKVASYYPKSLEAVDPMFEDPSIQYWKLKQERMKRRGKGPPKKGQGKRSGKK
uniref:Small ribosomal subunit protein mS33 n=1 Tax=Pyramimonas obovata TaxID=1411642 RepID=A0A6T7VLC2_9CHLO